MLVALFKIIGEVHFRLFGTNGFHAKTKNERFKLGPRLFVTNSKMKISRRRLGYYVESLHQKVCCTCSTIIFVIRPIALLICAVVVALVIP